MVKTDNKTGDRKQRWNDKARNYNTRPIQKKIDQKSTKNRPKCKSPFRDLHTIF